MRIAENVRQRATRLTEAREPLRAAAYYREAGDRASRQLAFDRAADFYRKALALADATLTRLLDLGALLAETADAGRAGRTSGSN